MDRANGIFPPENEEEREAERKGKAAANTSPSPNSEGRANSLAEETDEPACGTGSL
ncbi:hypothetical protein T4A_3679 [Trichinella pseudospiralis]|nr:hypothetical protein T4A_3679 [Trichinella pseudospiralis]